MVSRSTRRFARHYTTTDIAGRHKCRPYSSKPTWLDLIKVAPHASASIWQGSWYDRPTVVVAGRGPAEGGFAVVAGRGLPEGGLAVVSVRGTIPYPLRRDWAYHQGM